MMENIQKTMALNKLYSQVRLIKRINRACLQPDLIQEANEVLADMILAAAAAKPETPKPHYWGGRRRY